MTTLRLTLGENDTAREFRYELADPVRDRKISGRYEMRSLPLVS